MHGQTLSILALNILPQDGLFASAVDKRRRCEAPRRRSNLVMCCTENSVRISTKPCSLTAQVSAQQNYSYYVQK